MATYEINFPALQTAIGNLQNTLELLQKEIKEPKPHCSMTIAGKVLTKARI